MDKDVYLYDTTLRDGRQGENISFSVEDKIRIAKLLDDMEIDYIEGGWPGANPKDTEFFNAMKKEKLKHAKLVAFGMTMRAGNKPENDTNLNALLASQTPAVCIFGKTWTLHVKDVLKISLEENLDIIRETIKYLKSNNKEVIYDAEHFFDGYKADRDYAIKTLLAAQEGGADWIVLADTNGGTMPYEIGDIIDDVKANITTPLGIHTHNDSEMAVANTIMAVKYGVRQVQGTINGIGERCGNANLCSIIANIKLKMNLNCISDENLMRLTYCSRFVSELCNMPHNNQLPYVGSSAFAHKAGVHVNAMSKNSLAYEHVDPQLVGNKRRFLVSDQAGSTSIALKAKEFGINLNKGDAKTREILQKINMLEAEGYQFEGAEASLELLMKKATGLYNPQFDLRGFRVISEKREDEDMINEATIKIVVEGEEELTAAEGDGPVNALDRALRKALKKFYPQIDEMQLIDYKVRILNEKEGTAAKIRVLIESERRDKKWGTVGVSENIIEASWEALVDSVEYMLIKDREENAK